MSLRKTHSKEDLARIASDILKAPMFVQVVNELKVGFVADALSMKSTSEDRTKAAYRLNGVDLLVARLDEFVNEHKMAQATNSLHTT